MASTLKKTARRHRKSTRVKSRNATRVSIKAKAPRLSPPSLAEDRAQRRKIGKTLDVAAFMSRHKRNSTSKLYWEIEE